MKAVGYKKAGPITDSKSLIDIEIAKPRIGDHDVLVEVKGVSVNPVDVKVRAAAQFDPQDGQPKIIGYDAAGIVREVGKEVSLFKVGDEVFYAGDFTRQGTNAEFHAVDERIAGKKPKSLDFAEAAGLPLTSITAWEILFDSFGLKAGEGTGKDILIIGGAGGVGSILIQLAKRVMGFNVIATASRSATIEWTKKMGADHVINHRESLVDQMSELGISPKYVVSLNGTEQHFPSIVKLIQPRGHLALIDDPQNIDINSIKLKALSFSWEFMFARSMFQTADMNKQHQLLNQVAELIDQGTLVSTVTKTLGKINAETLIEAHTLQETGRVIGKNVLQGF